MHALGKFNDYFYAKFYLFNHIGFYHEQSRPDRDLYIAVNYANMYSGVVRRFQ